MRKCEQVEVDKSIGQVGLWCYQQKLLCEPGVKNSVSNNGADRKKLHMLRHEWMKEGATSSKEFSHVSK